MEWPHLIDNSLKAHHLYKRDVNYVVQDGEVVIVDEFTGRLMPGRQWSDGLHQAVEAKEGVKVKEENADARHDHAAELLQALQEDLRHDRHGHDRGQRVLEDLQARRRSAIPTNRAHAAASNHPDVIYRTEREKFVAIADEIERLNRWDDRARTTASCIVGTIVKENDDEIEIQLTGIASSAKRSRATRSSRSQRTGRPILVGTVSIEKSERLASLLDKRGIKHEVLNAKHHKREAEIVAQAGRKAP